MNSEHVDLEYKILVVGETEVGKTSTIFRYVDNTFNDDGGVPTVGIDVKNKYVTIDNKKIRVLLWDTAGQERFQSLTKNFFKGAHGILLLYDLTRKDTFIKLRKWITEIHNLANNPKLVVAGNKSDKINNREVTEQSLKDFGEKIYLKRKLMANELKDDDYDYSISQKEKYKNGSSRLIEMSDHSIRK